MKKQLFLSLCLLSCTVLLAETALQNNIKRAQRRANVSIIRDAATDQIEQQALAAQPTNGDEQRYSDKRASFGKGLEQNANGLINVAAFDQLVKAIESGEPSLFNRITMGTNPVQRKLVSPQAAFNFNLIGSDSWICNMPAAPTLASAETAGEMVEVYAHAYLRDVFFNDYDTNADAALVIAALNALSDFRGPKVGGVVTAGTLFRGNTPGDLVGPFISQFLYLPMPWGPKPNFDGSGGMPPAAYQEQVVPVTDTVNFSNDFMTNFNDWATVQQGVAPENLPQPITYTTTRHFIRNARDLGDYVHQDFPQQPYINAALILMNFGENALDPNNPFINNPTQEGFVDYNMPDIIHLVSTAAEMALRAAWYQKWNVHRRARPEFTGFLTNQQKTGAQDFGLHSDLINSNILTLIDGRYGSFFLPQAYPEGSPLHPSYPAGHATVSGACATILKAFFNEDFVIPDPVEPNAANDMLVAYTGTPLTAGNEINKLAANIALGRDMAGVHYRADGIQGILLGEKVAIAILENEAFTRHIPFKGFTLKKFDGTIITVGAKRTPPLY